MARIPKKAEKRIRDGIKKYRNVFKKAKDRDVNESDTVTIITDVLSDICGYDKYAEITREYAIRNTYCDLAIKIDDKATFLIEVKAIGIDLKEKHLRQAIQYAATEGIEWVILTNGDKWQAHKVLFEKPVKTKIAFEFSFIEEKNIPKLIDIFYLLSKEGVKKSAIDVFHEETQLTNRYMVAATLMSEHVIVSVRRQLRSLSSKVKITTEDIERIIRTQILKREVIDGDEAEQAKKRLAAVERAKKRAKEKKETIRLNPLLKKSNK